MSDNKLVKPITCVKMLTTLTNISNKYNIQRELWNKKYELAKMIQKIEDHELKEFAKMNMEVATLNNKRDKMTLEVETLNNKLAKMNMEAETLHRVKCYV